MILKQGVKDNWKYYKLEDSYEMTFFLIYYKNELYGIPGPDVLDGRGFDSYSSENLGEQEKSAAIKIIDPATIDQITLKEICEINNVPYLFIRKEEKGRVSVESTLESTFNNWVSSSYSSKSTIQIYQKLFIRFLSFGKISKGISTETFLHQIDLAKTREDLSLQDFKSDANGYTRIERVKMYNVLNKFHSWLLQKDISWNKKSGSRKNKKIVFEPLTKNEYEQFLKKLKEIDKRATLIAQIIWWHNQEFLISKYNRHLTLKDVLSAKVDDFSEDSQCLCFFPKNSLISIRLPKYIFVPLKKMVEKSKLFIFSNKKHGPLHPDQISKKFQQAGEMASLNRKVTPILLRPDSV